MFDDNHENIYQIISIRASYHTLTCHAIDFGENGISPLKNGCLSNQIAALDLPDRNLSLAAATCSPSPILEVTIHHPDRGGSFSAIIYN